MIRALKTMVHVESRSRFCKALNISATPASPACVATSMCSTYLALGAASLIFVPPFTDFSNEPDISEVCTGACYCWKIDGDMRSQSSRSSREGDDLLEEHCPIFFEAAVERRRHTLWNDWECSVHAPGKVSQLPVQLKYRAVKSVCEFRSQVRGMLVRQCDE